MLRKVICGFQDGADMGGIRAAKAAGLETGGWMPRGFLTESGPHPEYARLYGARMHASDHNSHRTEANIRDSDATIVFDASGSSKPEEMSQGTQLVRRLVIKYPRPIVVVEVKMQASPRPNWPESIGEWLEDVEVLNVAGNRESSYPGIGSWVERYLGVVFGAMRD